MHTTPTTSADALSLLRSSTQGQLKILERIEPIRFILDRSRSKIVFPVPDELALAHEAQLMIPDESSPQLSLLLRLEPAERLPGDIEIRYEIYHGKSGFAHWSVGTLEALRAGTHIFDSDEICLTDAIIAEEPALCALLNADQDSLRTACARAGLPIEKPVAVGVDPDGIDIRTRFGIARLPFDQRTPTPDNARAAIKTLLA